MSSTHQKLFLILIIIYADEIKSFLYPFNALIGLTVIGIILIYSYCFIILVWETNNVGKKIICSFVFAIPIVLSFILYLFDATDYAIIIIVTYTIILLFSYRKKIIEKIKENKIENDELKQTKKDLKYIDSLKKITKKDITKILKKK